TTIPSVKVNQRTGMRGHLAFYWSFTHTSSPYSPTYGGSEGFPLPITQDQGTYIRSHIERLNYDYSATPRLLLHFGAGYQQVNFNNDAPVLNYDAAQQLGLTGATLNRNFPTITGLCPPVPFGVPQCSTSIGGGSYNMGPSGQNHFDDWKPSANASATWVRGNHEFRFGSEFYLFVQ